MILLSGPVITEWLDDGIHMQVISEVSFVDSRGHKWVIPSKFITDGASIPQQFWSLIGSPFTGPYRIAAVFHDAAYDNVGVSKSDADTMLRETMLAMNCPIWLADIIYTGVRVGGASSYAADQIQAAKDACP